MPGSVNSRAAEVVRARTALFARSLNTWCVQRDLGPGAAAAQLGVSRDFIQQATAERLDPCEIAPSFAMLLMERTQLSAAALGFEASADEFIFSDRDPAPSSTGAGAGPLAVGGGTPCLANPPAGGLISATYEVPGIIALQIGAATLRIDLQAAARAQAAISRALVAARQAEHSAETVGG